MLRSALKHGWTIAYRDKKVVVSLCVFVRRFEAGRRRIQECGGSGICELGGGRMQECDTDATVYVEARQAEKKFW
jgi:hypothetical protein